MGASFKNWWAQPFSEDMDAPHWFAFIGLLIVIAVLWNFVLSHVTAEV